MHSATYAHLTQKALLIKGKFRDKEHLIRVAKAETKKAFGVRGKIRVVEMMGYRESLDGQVVVVEFSGEYKAPGGGSKRPRR